MGEIRTGVAIDASPEAVWEVLTRGEGVVSGEEFPVRIDGRLAVGERLTITIGSPSGGSVRYRPTVLVARPCRELRWGARLPPRPLPALFANEHFLLLEPDGGGRTRLVQGETFAGVLAPLLRGRLEARLRPGFAAVNAAVKAAAEAKPDRGGAPAGPADADRRGRGSTDGPEQGRDDVAEAPLVMKVAAPMRIGVIGAGNVGATVAGLLARAGHEVLLSNSRGPDSLRGVVARLGPRVTAASADAAAAADVVLLAVPWGRVTAALGGAGTLAGRVVIDATNPYGPGGPRGARGETSSERVRRLVPEARLVKSFNAIAAGRLGREADGAAGERLAMPLAGDDAGAKAVVAGLIADAGFDPVDTGGLRDGGRLQEPGQLLYNARLTAPQARALIAEQGHRRQPLAARLGRIASGMRQMRAN